MSQSVWHLPVLYSLPLPHFLSFILNLNLILNSTLPQPLINNHLSSLNLKSPITSTLFTFPQIPPSSFLFWLVRFCLACSTSFQSTNSSSSQSSSLLSSIPLLKASALFIQPNLSMTPVGSFDYFPSFSLFHDSNVFFCSVCWLLFAQSIFFSSKIIKYHPVAFI